MEEFNFIPDTVETQKPEVDNSGFSFTPDTDMEAADFTKAKPQNIFSIDGSNTDAPQKMEKVNKSLMKSLFSGVGNSALMAMPGGLVTSLAFDGEKVEKLANSDFGKFGNTMSQTAVRGIYETSKGVGQLISWYGDNMIIDKNMQASLGLEDKTVDRLNSFGRLWQKVGGWFADGSNYVLQTDTLKLDEEIFAGSIVENPSVTRVAAAAMSAAPSLMFMAGVSKVANPAVAYFLMAGAESSDLYVEAKAAGKTQEEANLLFTASMGGVAAVDFFMKPIEKIIAPEAKGLKGKIVQKIIGGLTEGTAEGSQEIWQNIVKKYGLDETQDIFEGVIESFIGGGFAGGAMAGGFTPSVEVSAKDTEALMAIAAREIMAHPDKFNDIVYQHVDAGLTKLGDFIEQHKGTAEAQAAIQTKKELDDIYGIVYDNLKGKQESRIAAANAKVVQGIALWGSREAGISPMEYLYERFPNVEKVAYKEFNQRYFTPKRVDGTKGEGFNTATGEGMTTETDFLAQDIKRLKRYGPGREKNKGVRLSQFIKKQGGIRDDRGDVKAMGATPGLINTKGGVPLDELTRMAWDAGYIQGTERPEINQLLDLLADDLSGKKVYTEQDNAKEDNAEYYRTLDEIISRAGGDIRTDSVEVIKQKLDAYENSLQDYAIPFDEMSNVNEEEWYFQNSADYATSNLQDILDNLPEDISVRASENDNIIDISKIVVSENKQGSGVGTQAMQSIINYADAKGKRVELTPSKDFGATSVERLKNFYKKFGFVENKGRNKDFSTRNTMYRNPNIYFQNSINQRTFDNNIDNFAKEYFGTTNNIKETGYIMQDGSLLDFSGKRFGGPKNTRSMDHREISSAFFEGEAANYEVGMDEFIDNGNIRYMPESDTLLMSNKPSSAQQKQIMNIVDRANGEITIELMNDASDWGNEDVTFYREYPAGTSYNKIKNDINSFYNLGKVSDMSVYYQTAQAAETVFKPSRKDTQNYIQDLRAAEQSDMGSNPNIRLGELPTVYKAVGVPDAPVRTNKRILLKDTIEKHNVPMDVVENLLDLYSDPLMVMQALDSSSNPEAYVAVLDAVDKDGNQMVAVISPNKREGGTNFITSFYGRSKIENMINSAIKENKLKYVKDKNESPLLRADGNQSSAGEVQSFPITKDGSIDSNILQKSDIVNDISYQGKEGAPEVYRNPKGAFANKIDGKSLISLFERADASTFMHETAHFFFEELKTFAKNSEKSRKMLDDVNKWLESDGETYTTEQVEKFARGFEQYLREGKAPSSYLKQAFNSFMNWLRQLYKTALELNVKLNDDVRSVYGDILGGQDLDFYLDAPVSEVLGQNRKMEKQRRAEMDDIYKQNISRKLAKKGLINKFAASSEDVYNGMRDWLSDALVPVEDRIKQISPDLFNMNRRLEISKIQRNTGYQKRIKNFVETMQKMPANEFHTFDLALKNRDAQTIAQYLQKYDLEKDFAEVRDVLNELREGMIEVGVDVEYLSDYYPRKIKDSKGFLDYIELNFSGKPEFSIIEKMLEEKNKDGRVRTIEDEAQIINSFIRGYSGGISIANIGNVKERTIRYVDEYLDAFYKNSLDALTDYISGAVQVIENKKYFGKETKEVQNLRRMVANRATTIEEYKAMEPKEAKWKEIKTRNYKIGAVDAQIRNTFDETKKKELQDRKTKLEAEVEYLKNRRAEQVKDVAINRMEAELAKVKKEVDELADNTVENSVGNLIRDLVNDGIITHTQEEKLKGLLLARFSNKGLGNEFLRFLRDGGYIWTLGNFESAITQFGDLGTSAYQNGLWNTAFEYAKAWSGKSEITMADLGLEGVIKDGGYTDTTALSKALDKVLKYAGFEKMDKIAKQTLVNSAIRKGRQDAKNNSPELESYLKAEFGEKWVDVMQDMKEGRLTDEIIEYSMFKLMDVQPITIDQMPSFYAEGGKKRMFYMMKSYFIKQLNEYRKICFETARTNPKKAVKDMMMLTAYLMLFNAGADLLKDILFGRKIDVADTFVDNIFIGGSINRYQAMSVKREGLIATFQKQLMFPVIADTFIVDALSDKEVKNWKSWSNIPLVGRPYYWWFGGGHLKTEKERKKELKKQMKGR